MPERVRGRNCVIYKVELFDRSSKQVELEQYFQKVALPYLKERCCEAYFFSAQYGLAPREYWLVTALDKDKPEPDGLWNQLLDGEPGAREITNSLLQYTKDKCTYKMIDLEPGVKWILRPGKMYHVENFNSTAGPGKLEEFFTGKALPYFRSRGFYVKIFKTCLGAAPADFWFITEMDSFSSLDKWPEMASGEPEGEKVMKELLDIIDIPKASIIKELPVVE